MNKYGNKCIAHCQFMLVKTLTNESYCYRVESTGMMIRWNILWIVVLVLYDVFLLLKGSLLILAQ